MHDTRYSQLTCSQEKAVFHTEGPLLVLAGPGSGKTRVITYRIAALIDSGVRPYNICAITFTNKAADEMRQRAAALGASAGAHISTFHSLCVRILRRYAAQAGISSNFSVYDESDQSRCIKQAVKDSELDSTNFPPARMLEAISALKNNLVDVEAFEAEAEDFFSKTLARIYARYQQILNKHSALDFDDLLMKTAFLLRSHPAVCSELGDRFKFLLIDEYQDTNHAQYKIAKSLVSQHNNICATGDPDQSIYRWRGADIRNILAFEKDWPDATIVKLEENFRSTANILQAADNLIAFNQKRKEKKLVPTKPPGKDVAIKVFDDELEEAEAVARQVTELAEQGASLKSMAVFYRVNAMSRVLEEVFIQNRIPYQIVRGVEFYSRKEIRDLLAYLKVLANPSDEIALLRIINTPARGIGKTTIDKIRDYAARNHITLIEGLGRAAQIDSLSKASKARIAVFADMLNQFNKDITGQVAPLAERVFVESGLAESLRAEDTKEKGTLENVNELINAAARYDQQAEEPSLPDYLQQIALFSDADAYDASSDRVPLMTLHAAKGLEFGNVFIVGLEDGLLPHERSTNNEDELEEERRLLFVGITRAKAGLYISYARYRTVRGQMLRTIPSQFLYELGIEFGERCDENQYHHEDDDEDRQTPGEFVTGQLVRHKSFGVGTVKEFVDMGENSIVVVKFKTGQTKSLVVKYAGLSKV
ncbi:MAG TPA: UvrD-helicase domain-containing protein [Sedimentisphaerales bacterium]|nr:UvrD-helicase domain-containing protein [Sedimentisphaerales bacterium]